MSKFESAESIFNKANGAFVDEDFSGALEHYNAAIQLEGDNAEFYIKRSACHFKLKNFTDAIADANNAIKLNPKLPQAYLRKGMAAFALEEFESAKASFEKGLEYDPSNSTLKTWSRKCEAELEEAGDSSPSTSTNQAPSTTSAPSAVAPTPNTNTSVPAAQPKRTVADYKPEPRIRHEWFQTDSTVSVGILSKNLKAEDTRIDLTADSLTVTIKLPEGSEYQLDLDLCGPVIPEQSKHSFNPTRLDIVLKKDRPCRWANLERVEGITNVTPWDSVVLEKVPTPSIVNKPLNVFNASTTTATPTVTPTPVVPKPVTTAPLATTPNPIPPKPKKNWDAIIKEAEEDEKPEGEEALQKVFQSIYANGSDEQRRAMMKSFIESGGTVLSTNWDEVGKTKVEGSPPKGMEMKNWKEKDQK